LNHCTAPRWGVAAPLGLTYPLMSDSEPLKRLRLLVSPAAAAFAGGALLVLLLTAALHLSVDRSSWHLQLDAPVRWAVLAHAMWQSWPIMVAAGFLAAAGTARRAWLTVASASVVCAIVFVWLASWSLFWATGQFLDMDSLALALASPGAMLLHVVDLAPVTLILVPIGCLLVTVAGALAVRRVSRARPVWRGLTLFAAAALSLFVGSLDSFAANHGLNVEGSVAHPEGGTGIRLGDLFEVLRRDRSDPVSHFRESLKRSRLAAAISPNIAVEWPDKVPYTPAPPARPHNVVVLVIESLRSDELAAYGSRLPVMPAIDSVAQDATVFLDHYAVATHSNYSAVSPVSSQFPLRDERTHIYPKNIQYSRVLLYDILKPLGYRTAIVSSQNEEWGGMVNFLASDRLDHFFHAGTYAGETYVPEEDTGFARYALKYGRSGKIDDAKTINEAIRWIGIDSTAAPFMMYINLQNSHVPYPIPANAPTPFGPRKPSFSIGFNYFPKDSAEVVRGVYRNALHYVDAQVGRLIDHLKNTGQWSNTIFVVVGDHGQAFFEHGFAAHSNELYEELLRTPLVIRAPDMRSELRAGLAQHVDIAPTILDLLGLPPHPGFQGMSLVSGTRAFAYSIVQTTMANQYGIVHGHHKLVIDTRTNQLVLRDLAADPAERHNVLRLNQPRAAYLRERLDTWHAAQLDYYANERLQSIVYAPVLPEQHGRLTVAK
jgi:arylsulfatase A-like enzyme